MKLTYKITKEGTKDFAYIPRLSAQKMTLEQLGRKIKKLRDSDPDFYSELVPVYIKLHDAQSKTYTKRKRRRLDRQAAEV